LAQSTAPPAFASAPVRAPASLWNRVLVGHVILAIWLGGSGVVVALQLVRIVRFRRRLRKGQAAPLWIEANLRELAQTVGVRPPALLMLPGLGTPLLWCLGRPQLLWPTSLGDRSDPDRWRAVMIHELAHLRRGDHWVSWLILAASWLWWWFPVYWYIRRRLEECADLACDSWVVSAFPNKRRAYAEALIEVSQLDSQDLSPAPAFSQRRKARHFFERRLTMIMSERVPYRLSLFGFAAVLALAALVMPAWPQQGSAQPPVQPKPPANTIRPVEPAKPLPAAASEPARIEASALLIPERMKPAAMNLMQVYAALKGYEKEKGELPGWISDLVPKYLSEQFLNQPLEGAVSAWPELKDPKLPNIVYRYQFSTAPFVGTGKYTFRELKVAERKAYGDVVPLVRIYFTDGNVLNVTWDGCLFVSGRFWAEVAGGKRPIGLTGYSLFEEPSATPTAATAQRSSPTVKEGPATTSPVKPVDIGLPAEAKQVFRRAFVHRSRNAAYGGSVLEKYTAADGRTFYKLDMRGETYVLTIDPNGQPVEYKSVSPQGFSSVFDIKDGAVTWDTKSTGPRGNQHFDWKPAAGTLPDFNSRPDPYLIQHILFRAYDFRKGGKQSLKVYDIDGQGTGINEYEISLEMVDQNGVDLPNGKFKARHVVQMQETPSGTWYKKGRGSQTDYWLTDDLELLRVYRHREPYEVIAQDYTNPAALIAATTVTQPAEARPAQVQPEPLPKFDLASVPGDLVGEGAYIHRQGGADRCVGNFYVKKQPDGTMAWISETDLFSGIMIAGPKGEPIEYRSYYPSGQGMGVNRFEPGKVTSFSTGTAKAEPPRTQTVSKDALPDFNTRPDPYATQHMLLRHYDFRKGGAQTFNVFDVDAAGKGYAEYQISLENLGEEEVDVPAGKFKARHVVVTQLTPSNTWYKKSQGLKTDFWVGDDLTVYRIYRHREPYELVLKEWRK
jgi:beta-lactamase regulating signal transducer with metallopeptidase domain